jgi:hypothetical protein
MKLFFFALFSTIVFTSQAQVANQNESYLLSGVVADSANNPLNDALVTLYLFTDSTAAASALTASDGGFTISIPVPAKYFLSIAALGYQSYFSQVIEVTSLKTKYVLPIINLRATGTLQLESVEIISKKSFVEQSIDRIIVHPEALISNAGTTALDVLEKSPGVQVDMDGNISLKGKGVMVYVDDKPTYLAPSVQVNLKYTHRFGINLARVLDKFVYKFGFESALNIDTQMIFINSNSNVDVAIERSSKEEALIIKELVKKFEGKSFAILTPYKKQVKVLKEVLGRKYFENIMTIHKSQGSEWDNVIFSVVDDSNFGKRKMFFTNSLNHNFKSLNLINTVVSRAKKD